MGTEIKIEKPKDTYNEIRDLIYLHYRAKPRSKFDDLKDGFAVAYPCIYSLYLQIAALGLHK